MNRNTNLRPLSASLMLFLLFIIHNKGWTQCNFSVDAGPDQTICSAGSTVQLNGSTTALNFSWSPVTGLSNPNALNPQAVVTQTTTYTLTATQPSGNNLITNGDFSQGNSGFTSDYGFDDCPPNQWGSLGCEGAYVVTTNSGTTHSNFSSCSDHTSGNGNMMAVNGANNAINIWCQVISVNPDTDYDFSAWATSLVSDSPARLQFSINGVTIGNIFNVSPVTCNWQEFSATWNSGGNTSATICVTNQNNAVGGNDFALDDISFEELCTVTDEVTIEVVEINGQIETPPILDCNSILQCIVLNGAGSSSSIPGIEYQWSASNGGVIQSGENTPNPTVCGEGTYTLVVSVTTSDGTVCTDDPQMVDVLSDNVPPQMPFITGPPSSCASSIGNYFFTGPQVYQNTNWFVIGDGILITDPEDAAAEVVWNSGGFGQVCLEVSNFCDIPPSITCHDVDILNIPETPVLTGPTVICADGNPVTYSIDNLSTVDNMFIWSPPDGSLIIPTGVDNVIMLLWDPNSTGGTLCVDVQNNCGLAPTECLTIAINTPLNTALDTVLCEGNTFNYNNTVYGNGNFSGTEIIAGYTGCDSLIVDVSVSEFVLQNVQLEDVTCDELLDGTTTSQTLQNVDGCDSLTIETTLIYTAPLIEMEEDETCDELLDGTVTSQTLQNVDGCDSLTIETTLIYTAPLIEMEEDETCDETLDGTTTSQTLQNVDGCDSLTIETTLIYTAPLIEMEEDETCDELLDGTVTSQTLQNVDGCDSLTIETTLIYTAPLIEMEEDETCDELLDGTVTSQTFQNADGCDSLTIETTLIYTAPLIEMEEDETCDETLDGTTTSQTFQNVDGCDSLTIETTLIYTAPLIEMEEDETCDELLDGTVTSQTFQNADGCDSVIINTTLVYTPPVNEAITAPTCDPLLDGTTSTETIFSESNCDSVIITTTLVLSNIPVTENINEVTCDASQNGMMSSETITGFSGCDSVTINTTLIYTSPVNEAITAPTCDPLLDGTTSTETILSESNCDSVIITTTLVLSNIPVTENLTEITCDPSQDGLMSSETITGFSGCDSVIINTTLIYTSPVNEAITAPTCDPLLDGTTTTETILSESNCDSVIITTTLVLSNIPVTENIDEVTCDASQDGMMSSETITGFSGCDSVIIETTLVYTPPVNEAITALTCDPLLDGTTSTETIFSESNCDSVIITTTLVLSNIPVTENINEVTCDASQNGLMSSETITGFSGCDSVIINTTLVYTPPVNEAITAPTCDPLLDGTTSTETILSESNCDSVIITTTLVLSNIPVTENIDEVTCDASQDGLMSSETITGFSGCDSVIINTTLVYTPPINEAITAPTCDPLLDGTTSAETIFSESNCDSVIITTTLVLSNIPVTENINEVTCDASQNGLMSSETITGFSGCDSVIIETTLVYTPPVNEAITAPTCDPLLDGTSSTETIFSESNCDSVIITTTLVLSNIPVTENIDEVTCDASQNGMMSSETITGFSGCDSVIINTTLVYTPPVNEAITAPTCDPLLDGTTSTETILSESNCDSVIITTTLVLSNIPVTENINEVTCDASQNGLMSSETITGFSGCDSVIINTTLVYTPPLNQNENVFTCDAAQDGNMTTNIISSQAGCDSIIITTTAIFIETVTTNLTEMSCNPEDTGISSLVLTGYQGCDSLVITEVILSDINLCSVEADLVATPIACGDSEGNISVTVNTGTGPFTVFWESDMTGPLGSVDIINRGDIEMITGLEAGDYTITVVSANGLEWSAVISLTQEESFTVELTADQRTNGFGVTCSDSEDGNIGSEIIGSPSLPVTYEWSNGQSGATLTNVAAGTYTLIVTDAMGCSAVGIEMITGPPQIDLTLESVDLTCFGENDGIILVDTVIGGSAPYEYMFSDQAAGPNMAWFNLSPGDYSVTVTDVNGCTGSQLSAVGTPEEIIADLGPDQEIALGSIATLDLNTSLLPDALDTIIWNGTDLEDCENCTVQEVAPFFSGSYEVIVVDTSGCTKRDEINIRVIKDRSVYIPNVFSPNGDGNNDRFFISTSAEAVEILEMNVYNRWGALVFSNQNFPPNNPGLGWNGLFREKEVNPGVFVYYVKIRFLDEAEKIYSGDVTIMK